MQIGAYAPSYARPDQTVGRQQQSRQRFEVLRRETSLTENDDGAMQRLLAGLKQDEGRIRDKNARLDTVGESSDILQRMRDISIRASGTILTDQDSLSVQKEISELKSTLNGITDAVRSYYRDAEREMTANLFSSSKFQMYANMVSLAKQMYKERSGAVSLLA